MVKKYFKKFKRRFFKRRTKNIKSVARYLMEKPDQRKVEMKVAVYAITNGVTAISGYSFASSTLSLVSSTELMGLTNGFTGTTEYLALSNVYQAVKLNGVSVQFNRTLNISNTAGNWLNLPPLCACLLPSFNSGVNRVTAYSTDNRMMWQVLNTDDKPVSYYYKIPKVLCSDGNRSYGSGVWNSTGSIASSTLYCFLDTDDDYINNSQTSAQAQMIGTLDFIFYLSFANRTYIINS